MVEYDPTSLWYAASLTVTADWLEQGGIVSYQACNKPPNNIRKQLAKLGVNTEKLENDSKLSISDWYSAMLGHKSKEKLYRESLKVADISIDWGNALKGLKEGSTKPYDHLFIQDDCSFLARFNEEKDFLNFLLNRSFPGTGLWQNTSLDGFLKGVHSESFYRQLEAAADGVIEFKFDDSREEPSNLFRIKAMRNMTFDGHWHNLKIGKGHEVLLDK